MDWWTTIKCTTLWLLLKYYLNFAISFISDLWTNSPANGVKLCFYVCVYEVIINVFGCSIQVYLQGTAFVAVSDDDIAAWVIIVPIVVGVIFILVAVGILYMVSLYMCHVHASHRDCSTDGVKIF